MRQRTQNPEIISQSLSALKQFMHDHRLNQTGLAKQAGVSRQYVSMILLGQRPPSQKLMNMLSENSEN